MSQEGLAARCAELGAPSVDRSVIANLEAGRRKRVTIEEVMALALALDATPLALLVPSEEEARVAITQTRDASARELASWLGAIDPLDGQDPDVFDETAEGVDAMVGSLGKFSRSLHATVDLVATLLPLIDATTRALPRALAVLPEQEGRRLLAGLPTIPTQWELATVFNELVQAQREALED